MRALIWMLGLVAINSFADVSFKDCLNSIVVLFVVFLAIDILELISKFRTGTKYYKED